MSILEALNETDKVVGNECFKDRYAAVNEYGSLFWYSRRTDKDLGVVTLDSIFKIDWYPYYI